MTSPKHSKYSELEDILWGLGVWDDLTHDQHIKLNKALTALINKEKAKAESVGYETGLKQLAGRLRNRFRSFEWMSNKARNDIRDEVNREVDKLLTRAEIPTKAQLEAQLTKYKEE